MSADDEKLRAEIKELKKKIEEATRLNEALKGNIKKMDERLRKAKAENIRSNGKHKRTG